MDLGNLYTEVILEHNKDTRNRREVEGYTHKERGHNPSCGDEITVEAKVEDGILTDLAYTGHGCSISQASASMMVDLLKGKPVEEALATVEVFLGMIKREITDVDFLEETLDEASILQGISNLPARVKCAVLAWHTLKEAVKAKA
ncbi:SUF system NifU family Fe-S cluster assembly protein [Proteiniclasticum sp. BAD-10]|uniref:SUF system NifU family Fe-S cluster assembly protein n=1 Tax=Proteiniclasticum sediminis TaxID=2804028 RepID=A0A941HPN4_9CLOT|nr:SUF system NifU family Fe-S cluster assembly protein [Proteiniclasticum sediminis]MBR0575519.1 SUF system NifU family Fe-S cluster assembly protein [Proteiniclasticum sediminis]